MNEQEWRDFLASPEFSEYRERELDAIAEHIFVLMRCARPDDMLKMSGALDLAVKMILLPATVCDKKDFRAERAELLNLDFAGLAARMVKQKYLLRDEDSE